MISECRERGLREPNVEDIDGMLRVNLWRPTGEAFARYLRGEPKPATTDKPDNKDNKPDNKDNKTDKKPIGTDRGPIETDREYLLLSYLGEHGASGVSELADLIGLGKDRTRTILREMTKRGLIDKIGDKRYTRYVLGSHGDDA